MRTAWFAMGVVLAGLLVVALLQGGGHAAPQAPQTPVALIARRVETLRGLRYSTLPVPQQVSPAVARREGLADYDRSYPPAQRHADETILRMLSLVPPGTDLRKVSSELYGEGGVAGYYDPRSKRLRIVAGAATGSRVLRDVTLATSSRTRWRTSASVCVRTTGRQTTRPSPVWR
jgi:hypothetical protein